MKARKGFTLVELLIVMAIIAALMAILIPMAGGAMKKAKATRVAVMMRNVEQAAEQYIMAYLPSNGNDITLDHLVDKGYLSTNTILTDITLSVNIGTDEYKIGVTYNGPKDADFLEMIYTSLKDTYSSIASDTDNGTITITATGSRFW